MRGPHATIVGIALLSALGCGGVHTPDGESSLMAEPPAGAGGGQTTGTTTTQLPAELPSESDSGTPVRDVPANGGSGSETDPALETPIEFCDAPNKLLTPKCGGGSCHGNQGAAMGDFAIDAQHAIKFVDKVSTRHAECGRIIDSRDYSKSFMLIKLRGDLLGNLSEEQQASVDLPYCGGRMPVGSIVITDDQIDCLASWLQQFQAPR
jgi:hypothetical protein